MPDASGTASVVFPAKTNAANGLSLLLITGGSDHASQAHWTGGITATIVTNFVVTNTNDSGGGSLRQAVSDANTSVGGNITFPNVLGSITPPNGKFLITKNLNFFEQGSASQAISETFASRIFN